MTTREIKGQQAVNRIRGYVDDATALEAIPSASIAPGSIVALKDSHAVAVYDQESAGVAESGRIHVPDDIEASDEYGDDPATAPGRWHIVGGDALSGTMKRTVTVGHADLTAAALTEAIDIGEELPANARILGVAIKLATAFSGGGAAAVSVDIGSSGDADAIVDGANLFAAAVDGQSSTQPAGIAPNKHFASATQLTATFISDVNVVGLTAGAVTIDVLFTVLA